MKNWSQSAFSKLALAVKVPCPGVRKFDHRAAMALWSGYPGVDAVRAIRDAPTLDAARAQADRVVNRYRREFPAGVAYLENDLEALLAIHRIPVRRRINVRTTNLVEERRRTKVIPRLLDERSAMKLVFATRIRCAQRWSRISISDLERHQLGLLRQELGIDPPPTNDKEKTPTKETTAA